MNEIEQAKHWLIHGEFDRSIESARALNTILAALNAKAERENPRALSLDELKERDGKPVWIEWPDGRIQNKWWIVGGAAWMTMDFFDEVLPNDYGKTWIAYDYELKEEKE